MKKNVGKADLGSNFMSWILPSSSPTTIPRDDPSDMKAVDSTVWLSISLDTNVNVRSSSRHTRNWTLLQTSAINM